MRIVPLSLGAESVRTVFPTCLDECEQITTALNYAGRSTITLVGGLPYEPPEYQSACHTLLRECIFPLASRHQAVILSRGFSISNQPENDVPFLADTIAATFRDQPIELVGVGLEIAVRVPTTETSAPEQYHTHMLGAHHSNYVLAPGTNEREASTWRSALATSFSKIPGSRKKMPGIVLVFGGATVTWYDIVGSLNDGRHIVAITHPQATGTNYEIEQWLLARKAPTLLISELTPRVAQVLRKKSSAHMIHAISHGNPSHTQALLQKLLNA